MIRSFGAVSALLAIFPIGLYCAGPSAASPPGGTGQCSFVLDGAGITPSTNEFFMYYFVLTGLHMAYVVIGLIVLTVLSTLASKPEPTRTHIAYFEGGACFSHMVDPLWIFIFPLVFLVR